VRRMLAARSTDEWLSRLSRASSPEVRRRLTGQVLHAPAHVDAEVLSVLGWLQRAGELDGGDVEAELSSLVTAPLVRHPVDALLLGACSRRHRLRLADAL
jgi:predicted nucleic acid-binding protein